MRRKRSLGAARYLSQRPQPVGVEDDHGDGDGLRGVLQSLDPYCGTHAVDGQPEVAAAGEGPLLTLRHTPHQTPASEPRHRQHAPSCRLAERDKLNGNKYRTEAERATCVRTKRRSVILQLRLLCWGWEHFTGNNTAEEIITGLH